MSLRLRLFTLVMRWLVQPVVATSKDPDKARRGFRLMAWFFRVPPDLLHLVDREAVPVHWISSRRRDAEWVILYLHGGGYITGSPDTHVALAGRIARLTGLQVASVDYRLAPEHPAPAAYEDARAAHARLLAKGYPPGKIILGGDSAGGGLALALLADLCARGMQPAGLFAFSPWTDLAMTGDSLTTNEGRDPLLPVRRMPDLVEMVLAGIDPRDPRISPLYARFQRPPPVLLQVGSVEILLDDSRRMAEVLRQAGGAVRVAVWPGCPHVWQLLDGYLPEARQALEEVRDFVAGLQVTAWSQPPNGN
jgi:acetyl esterase/lipase